jgi:hypothetical protein
MTRYQRSAETCSLLNVALYTIEDASQIGDIAYNSTTVPLFLYCDVISSKSTIRLHERLKVTFNSCARYIFGISRRANIIKYTNQILGTPLDQYYSFRSWLHHDHEQHNKDRVPTLCIHGASTLVQYHYTCE